MLLPGLSDVLVFKPHLRVERVDSEVVFLVSETQRFALSGASTARLVELIDGQRDVDAILRAAPCSEPEALYTLGLLVERGYLVEASPGLSAETLAYWHGTGLDARTALAALARSPVSLTVLHDAVPIAWMNDALKGAGVRVEEDAAIHVVVTDDYLRPELDELNRRSLERKSHWFLVKPVGAKPLIGPAFRPGEGPCWECLAFAMRNNRPVEEVVRRRRGLAAPPVPPRAALEGTIRTACGMSSLFVARTIATMEATPREPGRAQLLALDLGTLQTSGHTVVRRPQCATCGDPKLCAAIGERPIELHSVAKAHYEDGGFRRQPPRRTFDQLKHLVSPITGAVTHVVPFPGRHTELRAVYASGYLVCPRAGIPHGNVFDKGCAGKGRSDEQAKVSALCETLERYSGVYQGDEARVRASQDELGAAALPLPALLQFSERQYARRVPFDPARMDWREFVPEPFDSGAQIDWSPAWSLTHDERRYVPLPYCYAEAPLESGVVYTRPCGNGVAAGTNIEEAILQGLLELVERDAAALWWYSRARRPAIDLRSFGDSYFDALQADYARLGWSTWVLDLTHDLGIPTCVALAHDPKEDRFSIGFGCHLQGRLAAQRALTELNQIFEPAARRRAPWDLEGMRSREYLFPDVDRGLVSASSLPVNDTEDLRLDIESCIRRLRERDLDIVVVDKTRPDIGLSVAQVIVPGLRHFWPRFGPGRLYTVPHELGWVPAHLDEEELNPVHLFV